jgi:hypothetical protein
MGVAMPKTDDTEATEGTVVPDDPANIKDSAGAVVRKSEFDAFLANREAEKADTEQDPYEAIIKQVLNAESPDAVLTPTEVLQGRDLIDIPIVVLGFVLNKSEYDVGSPFYATMDVVTSPDAPPVKVNCGHKKVIAQLVRLEQLGAFPQAVRFITRGTSKVGGTPMLELTKWTEEQQTQLMV